MSWWTARSEAALARMREWRQQYDRYFLLRHLGVWHTSLHWITPVSVIVCLVMAVIVLLRPSDEVLSVDQFVYPVVVGSVIILLAWMHAQSGAMLPFRPPVRRRILRLLILRLACVMAVFLPPVVLGVTMHAHTGTTPKMEMPLSRDTNKCLTSLGLAQPNCTDTEPGVPDTLDDAGCGIWRLRLSEQILAHDEGLRISSEGENLQTWIGDYCKELATAAKTAKKTNTAESTAIKPVAEKFWKALESSAPKALRVYIVTHYTFPRQLPRSLMYLLTCVCVTFPFLGVWVGYRMVWHAILAWSAITLFLSFVGGMRWLEGQGLAFDTLAYFAIFLCGVTLVASPIALCRRVPARRCLFLFTSALIAGPFLPISVLRLHSDWGESMPAPMLDDPALPSLILLEFWPGGHREFGVWEWYIYAFGLAYCCIFLMVVGPIMQRISASPK
ncbi:hypothetical protein [Nannocystis radixulma]|uniref:ABC-2 family transporter protein n=1 Tax=Nannocystis radixulma TaxID=2995305 RepID=A0ABT5BDY0_9BACT|nr:hypothetical protein [Nannocystis radixulma]MDC0672362.1 hypothetical protein [Nannocystis radixulma]